MFAFFKNLFTATTSAGDLKTLTSNTEAEIADLEKKLGAKAPARPEFLGNRALVAQAMIEHRESLKALVATPVSEKPVVPKAAAAKSPAKSERAASASQTISEIGRTVATLATDPRASVRTPIIEGLGKSMEAAQVVSPCFDFLSGFEKVHLKREWQERGGLSDRSLKLFNHRRAEFCKANKMTPEEAYSCPDAPLPKLVIESEGEQKARVAKLSEVERNRSEELSKIDTAIAEAAGTPEKVAFLEKKRAGISDYCDREKARLSKAPTA